VAILTSKTKRAPAEADAHNSLTHGDCANGLALDARGVGGAFGVEQPATWALNTTTAKGVTPQSEQMVSPKGFEPLTP